MFYYLNGTVALLEPNLAVIDCGGVGYAVNTSQYTSGHLTQGEKAKLYTVLNVREDCFELYGFAGKSEKRCYEMLTGVSGVGPKAALSILSSTTPEKLMMSILSEDAKALTAAPGVGKKIAQRIILELKDKFSRDTGGLSDQGLGFAPPPAQENNKLSDAAMALSVLGYGPAEINEALKNLDSASLSLEELIKAALRQMVR